MNVRSCCLLLLLSPLLLWAETATGGNLSLHSNVPGISGCRSTGGPYALESSSGNVYDIPLSTGGSFALRGGFTGQLTDPKTVVIGGNSALDEETTTQLQAHVIMDDDSQTQLSASSFIWSVLSGPISISPSALVTAQQVFEQTAAQVQALYQGVAGSFDLSVNDSQTDNFEEYANDQIDDAWQVSFFGLPPNALALPTADGDGDGQDNLSEFYSGFDPTDGNDYFIFRISAISGDTSTFLLNKVIPNRSYTLQLATELPQFSTDALSISPSSTEVDRSLQHNSVAPLKFYRIRITRP